MLPQNLKQPAVVAEIVALMIGIDHTEAGIVFKADGVAVVFGFANLEVAYNTRGSMLGHGAESKNAQEP